MQGCGFKIHLLPPEITHLSGPEPMTKGEEDHEGVAVALAIDRRYCDKPLHLVGGEMLSGSELSVRPPLVRV
jgi:hypothetical protein